MAFANSIRIVGVFPLVIANREIISIKRLQPHFCFVSAFVFPFSYVLGNIFVADLALDKFMRSAKATSPNPTPNFLTSRHSQILNLLIRLKRPFCGWTLYVLENEHYLSQKCRLGRLVFCYALCVYPGGPSRHLGSNKTKQIPQFGCFVLHAASSTSYYILMKTCYNYDCMKSGLKLLLEMDLWHVMQTTSSPLMFVHRQLRVELNFQLLETVSQLFYVNCIIWYRARLSLLSYQNATIWYDL